MGLSSTELFIIFSFKWLLNFLVFVAADVLPFHHQSPSKFNSGFHFLLRFSLFAVSCFSSFVNALESFFSTSYETSAKKKKSSQDLYPSFSIVLHKTHLPHVLFANFVSRGVNQRIFGNALGCKNYYCTTS